MGGEGTVNLTIFPQQQRLCSTFEFVRTPLCFNSAVICLKPSFSFPFIKPPNMIPCVDYGVIMEAFKPTKKKDSKMPVALKPEAPWIKKDEETGAVRFTDEIYETDINFDECDTPDSDKRRKDEDDFGELEIYS